MERSLQIDEAILVKLGRPICRHAASYPLVKAMNESFVGRIEHNLNIQNVLSILGNRTITNYILVYDNGCVWYVCLLCGG